MSSHIFLNFFTSFEFFIFITMPMSSCSIVLFIFIYIQRLLFYLCKNEEKKSYNFIFLRFRCIFWGLLYIYVNKKILRCVCVSIYIFHTFILYYYIDWAYTWQNKQQKLWFWFFPTIHQFKWNNTHILYKKKDTPLGWMRKFEHKKKSRKRRRRRNTNRKHFTEMDRMSFVIVNNRKLPALFIFNILLLLSYYCISVLPRKISPDCKNWRNLINELVFFEFIIFTGIFVQWKKKYFSNCFCLSSDT